MKHLSALIFVFLSVGTFAQEFPYEFTVTNEAYAHFEDGTDAVLNTWDDPDAMLPMGFDFYFFERQVDTWYLNSDFGTGGALIGDPGPNGTVPIFFVYGSDLIDIGYLQDSLISTITYKTTGDAPNRVFHLQYDNCGFYSEVVGSGTAGDQINLQMRMYEGSNDIEIHFGPNSIKNPDLAHDGMGGTSILMVDSLTTNITFDTLWLLQGDGQAPEVNPFNDDEVDDLGPGDFLTSDPSNGTLYRFSSSFVNVEEEVARAGLYVYPNPSRDVVWVQSPAQGNQPFVLRNMSGAVVLDGTLRPGQNHVDLGGLPAGLYLLDTPASSRPTRIVKQ